MAVSKAKIEPEIIDADDADEMREELERSAADHEKMRKALQQEQQSLALAKDRITQPGVAMDKPSIGVTPDAALALYQAQINDVQNQLDELSDLARQHSIEPGVLRG